MKKLNLMMLLLSLTSVILMTSSCKENDPCDDIDCQNEGICLESVCECPEGIGGINCETVFRNKLFGTHDVAEFCSLGSTINYPMTIKTNPDGLSLIFIEKMYNIDFTGTATMTDANNFEFASETQSINGSDWTLVSGSGVIDLNTVTINYTMQLNGSKDDCTAIFML